MNPPKHHTLPQHTKISSRKIFSLLALGLAAWAGLYSQLMPLSERIVALTGVARSSHLGEALAFFFYDAPKVIMLLSLVVFFMGIVRSFFAPERTRALLSGKKQGVGNVLAACFGIVTPFCTCSAVSIFIGFVAAGIPLGITFSFLIAAPMVNEIALGLLFGLVGWKVAALYLAFGLSIAIVAGWILGHMNLEPLLEPWVRDLREGKTDMPPHHPTWPDRIKNGFDSMKDILGKVWIWMLLGIAVGAGIHGFAPADILSAVMGKEAWWSVPLAVVIGIPMYANAAGIIPIVEALLGKGAALGTVLAFMMSVTALSLPEAIILRKVLSLKLIALFFGIVGAGILAVGFLFNAFL